MKLSGLSTGRFVRVAVPAVFALGLLGGLAGCGGGTTAAAKSSPAPPCPVTPISVVATTNVWGNITDQLAGACADITTVVESPATDPHEFEPTAATSGAFAAATLAVSNGLGYDSWANRIDESLGSEAPPLLDLGTAVGLKIGANPHIWYSPTYVPEAAEAITAALTKALPSAAEYFDIRARQFTKALGSYRDEVAAIKATSAGTKIGATESLFDYMAQATGLIITTPQGFRRSDGGEPSAADVGAFRRQLSDGSAKALIYNAQSDGGLPGQLKQTAQDHQVPVIAVTETLVPADASFQQWQLAQLRELAAALPK